MIDNQELKQLAQDAEQHLGVPQQETISLLIQGCIRAYKVTAPGLADADVTAQFNPSTWSLDVIVKKKIVKSVVNPHCEIGMPEAKLIAPTKTAGDTIDVVVTDEVKEAAAVAFSMLKEGLRAELKKRIGDSAELFFNEIANKCVNAKVSGRIGNDVIMQIGSTTVRLPESEQVEGESYVNNAEYTVYVKGVVEFGYKSEIVVSRSDAELVRFAMRKHVPEIDGGLIEIKGVGRIPGKKAVVALHSKSEDVIERCLGKEHVRLHSIKAELGGVDVRFVEWYEKEQDLLASALGFPIKEIQLNESKKTARVEAVKSDLEKLGEKTKLYSALAEELTGWSVEIIGVDAGDGPKIGLQ